MVQGAHKNLLTTKILMSLKQNGCSKGNICGVQEALVCVLKSGNTRDQYVVAVGRKGRDGNGHLLQKVSRVCTLPKKRRLYSLQSNWTTEIVG